MSRMPSAITNPRYAVNPNPNFINDSLFNRRSEPGSNVSINQHTKTTPPITRSETDFASKGIIDASRYKTGQATMAMNVVP